MPIHEAPIGSRSPLAARQILAELSFILLLVVLLAVTGPFGTFQSGPWPTRVAYWVRTLLVGYVLYRPSIGLAAAGARSLGVREQDGWVMAVVAASVPMTLWLWFFGPTIDLQRPWPSAAQFIETYAQAAFIAGLAVAGLWWLAGGATDISDDAPAVPAPAVEHETAGAFLPTPAIGARLAERLPVHLGQDVIALEMEDHYVRVHTIQGSTLVLMRMADALQDLAAIDGLRVHRSWWAAKSAIIAVKRSGRTATLQLSGGIEVPVARDRLPDLRAKGWLS